MVLRLVKQIGLVFLVGIFLGIGKHSYANQAPSTILSQSVTSSLFQGNEWVKFCTHQYPEILYLADDNVRKTEEGSSNLRDSYSKQLFNKKFVEFDRTIMTLHCLRLILDGSDTAYLEFIQDQPEAIKLSRKSFHKLHKQGIFLLQSAFRGMSEIELRQAMEASLVLGDIGKSEKARALFKSYGAQAVDHDDFHEEVMQILQKHPELSPTFHSLTPTAKKLLIDTANLAHYGHITHMEGGANMFSKLKQNDLLKTSPIPLLFDFFIHTCDVAGALGHINHHSSLVYTEPTHLAMQAVFDACKLLEASEKTEIDAYNAYLTIRANWLGLNAQNQIDRVLTRVGAMLRLFTPEDGTALKQAILTLSPDIQSQIIKQLDILEMEQLKRTPTYIPAMLVNLFNQTQGSSKENQMTQVVTMGLPFIAHVLKTHKEHLLLLEADPNIPLNFNQIAGIAKTDPNALKKEFSIDSEGVVWISGH